jgi:hypothetical protein
MPRAARHTAQAIAAAVPTAISTTASTALIVTPSPTSLVGLEAGGGRFARAKPRRCNKNSALVITSKPLRAFDSATMPSPATD